MLRGIAIYQLSDNHTGVITPPESQATTDSLPFFSSNTFELLESQTLIGDVIAKLEYGKTHLAKAGNEYHYLCKPANESRLMAICSARRLTAPEITFLFINIQNILWHQNKIGYSLQDMVNNPLGYTGTDRLPGILLNEINETKKILLTNIDKLLEREEQLQSLELKTIELSGNARLFRLEAQSRQGYCWGYCGRSYP